jgi:transcriptional regulator with XRE-family HTH domain
MRAASANGARINRATWLRRIRTARHLTQAQVARAARVSTNQISRYERARDDPSLDVLDRLLVALECWYVDLQGENGAPTPAPRPMRRPAASALATSIQLVIDEFTRPNHPPADYPDMLRCFTCHGRPGECQCYLICAICGLPYRRKGQCSGVLHHRASRAAPRGIAH